MSREAVEGLIDRWINDSDFREELRNDLEGAVRRTGIQLDDDEWAALQKIEWTATDEELKARLNKPSL